MNTKKLIFLALGGIAITGVGYLVFNRLRKKPKTQSTDPFSPNFEE